MVKTPVEKISYKEVREAIRKMKQGKAVRLSEATTRGGVENTRLEAKAKDTKKIRPFRGQTLSRPRPRTKDTSASALQKKKRSLQKFFRQSPKKKVLTKIFQAISTKKRFPKNFSSTPRNFNNSKNTAVLEPRTGQFLRT